MTTPAAVLVKGQNAPLAATTVRIAVAVQAPTDLSALLVTDSGKVRSDTDFIFFNQPDGPGVRCVREGQTWVLDVDLAAVPADITTVRAVVNLETQGQRFGSLPAPVATVTSRDGAPLAEYSVTGLDSEMIMVALELYRRGADWKVRAVGQGYAGGLAELIRDHGVSVDDAPASPPPAATSPPAPAAVPAPTAPVQDSGGAFGSMTPPPAPPAPTAPAHDSGGAFGSMSPPPTPPAAFPPPSAPPGAYPPPNVPAQAFPPPSAPAAQAFPPPQGTPAGGAAPSGQDQGLTAGRPVSLQKGQKVSLSKSGGGGALTLVRMGLGWDPLQKKRGMFGSREVDIDLDASAVLYSGGNPVDLAFYNSLTSKDGSVQHQGDNRTGAGDGDDETIVIDLTRVGAHIDAIVFIVTSYEGQTFEQVQNAFCRLVDHTNGGELARYTLTGGMPVTGMVMAKVSRAGNGWQMQAIGEGIQAKTPSEAFPQLARFL